MTAPVPPLVTAMVVTIPAVVTAVVAAMVVMFVLDARMDVPAMAFPMAWMRVAHYRPVLAVRPVRVTGVLVAADHVADHRAGDERQRFVTGVGASGGYRNQGRGRDTGAQQNDGSVSHLVAPDDDRQGTT